MIIAAGSLKVGEVKYYFSLLQLFIVRELGAALNIPVREYWRPDQTCGKYQLNAVGMTLSSAHQWQKGENPQFGVGMTQSNATN